MRAFDEYGRELAFLEQLEPDWVPPDDWMPENYGLPNYFIYDSDLLPEGKNYNCVTSWCPEDRMHRLVLDLDFECRLLPSSSPGCYHLYLDGLSLKPLEAYNLLAAMSHNGMIEKGFFGNWKRDSKLCVRSHGNKKHFPKPAKGEGRKANLKFFRAPSEDVLEETE